MAMFVLHMEFKNEPQRLEARRAHREHLTRLHETGRLIIAGPWADDTGALHIYDVADEAELRRILETDPYTTADAYEIAMLKEWTRLL